MAKSEPIALRADPNDPDDFDVSEAGLAAALANRQERKRVGRPPGSNKEHVALRIDKDVLARWRASGAGWQSRMNAALRAAAPRIAS